MQAISIAPAVPAASASPAAGGAPESGEEMEGAGGLFGAILAGQMKGKVAKGGADVALLEGVIAKGKVGADKAKDKSDVEINAAALSDLLAAAGINLVSAPVVAVQQAVVASNDAGIKFDRLAAKTIGDAAGDASRLDSDEDVRASGVEEFAGNGKMLSVLERAAVEKAASEGESLDDAVRGKSDLFASRLAEAGGAKDPLASAVVPFALPMTQSAGNSVAGGAPVRAMEISEPVGSPAWGEALGDKVVWMSGQGSQVAELRLDPPHLGPLEVRLTMVNDQATAVFVSHHSAVREAIESAMPRLREMLADSGIMLGNTMVGAESFQQQQQAFSQGSRSGKGAGQVDSDDQGGGIGVVGQSAAATAMGKGLVDMFV